MTHPGVSRMVSLATIGRQLMLPWVALAQKRHLPRHRRILRRRAPFTPRRSSACGLKPSVERPFSQSAASAAALRLAAPQAESTARISSPHSKCGDEWGRVAAQARIGMLRIPCVPEWPWSSARQHTRRGIAPVATDISCTLLLGGCISRFPVGIRRTRSRSIGPDLCKCADARVIQTHGRRALATPP